MADEIPQLYLLRYGGRYVVTEAVISVDAERLPPAVSRSIDEAMGSSRYRIEGGIRLPEASADERSALSVLQSFKKLIAWFTTQRPE